MHGLRPLEKVSVVLAILMAIGLAGAIAMGILHILWVGTPRGTTVSQIAFTFGFLFGGSLLLAFLIAAYEEVRNIAHLKTTDPNEFGAEV
jgi:hypothetical protein